MSGSSSIRIGADGGDAGAAAEGNVIAGSSFFGIALPSVTNCVIAGNDIGLDAAGSGAAAGTGGSDGIWVNSSSGILVGTNGDGVGDAAERNVIAGGWSQDVQVGQSTSTVVAGNYIGVDSSGTQVVGASQDGIYVWSSSGILIGTNGDSVDNSGERNVVDGSGFGIEFDQATSDSQISGNYVGLDATGTIGLGNSTFGILINGPGTLNNIIGTNGAAADNAAERNVVSGNGIIGIFINQAGTGNVAAGNYVGTDASGTKAVGSQTVGIVSWDTSNVLIGTIGIGSSSAAERHVISGGNQYGVEIAATQQGITSGTVVARNFIGTDAFGTNPLGNSVAGVIVTDGTTGSQIEDNVIAANGQYGIWSTDAFNVAPGSIATRSRSPETQSAQMPRAR